MGTFFRAIIALIAAIFLGLGALLLVGFGVCALAATTGSMGVFEAGVVVGIITIVDIYACGDSRDCCSFLGYLAEGS